MKTAVALLLIALFVVPVARAGPDAPSVLVQIENLGQAREIRVTLESLDGDVLFDDTVLVPADGAFEVEVRSSPGFHSLALAKESDGPAAPLGFEDRWIHGTVGDTTGCPAAYAFRSTISAEGAIRGTSVGCVVLGVAARAILDEARALRGSRAWVAVPLPRDADRGVLAGIPFEWRSATFPDAYGREVDGHEVVYRGGSSGGSTANGLVGTEASAEARDPEEVVRFAAGDPALVSWSTTRAGPSSSGPTESSAILEREIRYGPMPGIMACVLRSPIQGTTLRAGDHLPPERVCPDWGGPAWRVGAPVVFRGLRALPLYQIEESAERTAIARLLYVDGLAYPVDAERHVLPAGGLLRSANLTLDRFQHGGAPLPAHGPSPLPPPPLAELDPWQGPEGLGLADASEAALLLPRVRVLALAGDAALAGALFRHVASGASSVPTWEIVFSAPSADPVHVSCLAIAVPTCRERPDPLPALASAPRLGAADLPARAPTFEDALARWSGEAPVTYAFYRAWDAPVVVAGAAAPAAAASGPLFLEDASATSDLVVLDLVTGRTVAAIETVEAISGFDPASLAPVQRAALLAGARDWTSAESLPYLVGGGVGIALAVLLGFLLYSRLVRSRVLDDGTRSRMIALVSESPGLHASAILDRLGKRSGVGEYHLDVLVREGHLTRLATPGFRRYFVTGRHTPQQMRAIAAQREGQNEKLLAIIRANPGIELRILASEAGVSVPYASRGVARLAEAGLVDKVAVGRSLTLHAAEA